MRKYKLGCNWSNALKNLIMRNSINIDYIKAGEQKNFNELMQEMRELRPILLHGGIGQSLRTGMQDFAMRNAVQELSGLDIPATEAVPNSSSTAIKSLIC